MEVAKKHPFIGVPAPVGLTVEYGKFCVSSNVLVRFEVDTSMGAELKWVCIRMPDPFIGVRQYAETLIALSETGHVPKYVPLRVQVKRVGFREG